jgi:hypothetical protein
VSDYIHPTADVWELIQNARTSTTSASERR